MRITNTFLALTSTFLTTKTTNANNDARHAILDKVQPFGYQSTSSRGNDFAASIVKSPRVSQGYFTTGTTSGMLLHTDDDSGENTFHAGMHCYVMQMKPFADSPTWIKKFGAFRDGTPTPTTCTSVRTLPVKKGDTDTKVVVVGYTEGDVLFNPDDGDLQFSVFSQFSEIAKPELAQNKVNGFAMILSVPHSEDEKETVDPQKIKVIGGKMLHAEKVTYPISLTPVGDHDFVVVSMVTDETGLNLETALKDAHGEIGDFEPVFRYGQFYKVKVERLTYDTADGRTHKMWYEVHETSDGLGAHVSSVIYDELEDAVTVAGTTHGHGKAFGKMEVQDTSELDLDGYFFSLNAKSGKLHESVSERIETVPGKDEIISGMCKKKNGDAIYIVGSTNHVLDDVFEPAYDETPKFNAFIRKINLNNMKPIWTRQIGPVNLRNDHTIDNQDVMGMGCAVDEEKSQVYVSGTVAAGASVVPGQYPTGEQDIFVAAFHSTNGNPIQNFPTRQVGSVMDEYVAKDGGGITTDQYGNAVLFGTTKGNFLEEKPPKKTQFQAPLADIYFMSFLKDQAEHVSTIEKATPDGIKTTANEDWWTTKTKEASPLEVTAICLFSMASIITVGLLAYKYGKHRTADQIEYQTGEDVARYLEDYEKGHNINNNSGSVGAGTLIDAGIDDNSSYSQRSKKEPTESAMSRRVSLPDGDLDGDLEEAPTKSYDELMESYKDIMSETSAVTAVAVDSSGKDESENTIV